MDISAATFSGFLAQLPNGVWSQDEEETFLAKRARLKFTVVYPAVYLGGLPNRPGRGSMRQTLRLGPEGIFKISNFAPQERLVRWEEVESVDVDGGAVARQKVSSRVAMTLAFGVWGAMATTGTKDRTYILVSIKDGNVGIWELDKVAHMEVRATMAPLLHHVGVPLAGGRAVPTPVAKSPAGLSVADELEKLGALRDKGLLTTAEFAEQKQRLLEGG